MVKGILHVHSDFSYDGINSIEEIANWAKSEKIDFVILTEHDNDFNDEKFDSYLEECRKNSNNIIIVPGIEYSFGKKRHIHINVFGIDQFLNTNNTIEDIPRFLKTVKSLNGIAVLNHPKSIVKELGFIDLSSLFGVELWNTKSDFLYSPDPRTYKLVKEKLMNKAVFVTSDIHTIPKNEYAKIISMETVADINSVVTLIRNRSFYCVFNNAIIENTFKDIQLNKVLLFLAGSHHKTYRFLRSIKRVLGLNVSPKIVKMIKLK
ncbi:PHP domain-containing protein [Winogradskyella aquimaris]|uniref:PHP domain-containing protein n=1 Tax=Winogradskyella aquimaris TaxID=864074 RepID=A0ABU5EL87_9FLAO|nr:PHP domain-containing protein [Winogradskyella aquimaris]MDY2587082.1 PHP domain-containing protein [Winogradskyella aquimaris]